MNDKQIAAMSESAKLFNDFRLPTNFLYELIEESFKVHEWMGDTFELGYKNNYRVTIPISDELHADDPYHKFLIEICKIKGKELGKKLSIIDRAFIQDESKNKFRVTRILDKDLWKKLINTDDGAYMAALSAKVNCCVDCTFRKKPEYLEVFVKNFNIWYGEQIKGGMHILLSCHPLDILKASNNSSFQSCYRPDGEWFNGVISSMLSPNTLIASIEEIARPGYKIGRSWIYVNETMILAGRCYGGITAQHHLYIRNFLYGKMGGNWVHTPSITIGENTVIMNGPGYLDNGTGSATLSKAVSTKKILLKKVEIPMAICMYCGKRFDNYGRGAICKKCAETSGRIQLF
jgi:hypothetical protein